MAQARGDLHLSLLRRREQIPAAQRPIHRDRHPGILRCLIESREGSGCHADDDEVLSAEVDRAAKNQRVTIEECGPCLFAQNGDCFAARNGCVRRREAAAETHANAEHREIVARHESDGEGTVVRDDAPRRLRDDSVEDVAPALQVLVVLHAEAGAPRLLRSPTHCVEAVRIVHGERTKHVGVEDAEYDGDEAHADGQREDRRRQERATVPEPSPRVAQVLRELTGPNEVLTLVKALARPSHVAKVASRP